MSCCDCCRLTGTASAVHGTQSADQLLQRAPYYGDLGKLSAGLAEH